MSAVCAGCGDKFGSPREAVDHARNVHPELFEGDGGNPLARFIMDEPDVGCGECHAAIPVGAVYAHKTLAPAVDDSIGGAAIVEIVCLDCAQEGLE